MRTGRVFCKVLEHGKWSYSGSEASIGACSQVLSKTMDSTTLSPEKIELSTVRRDEANDEVSRCWTIVTMHGPHLCGASSRYIGDLWMSGLFCQVGHELDLLVACLQVLFHIYEDAELKPLLDAVNDQREKEKEKENES